VAQLLFGDDFDGVLFAEDIAESQRKKLYFLHICI
jgi:hypothetical protein